MAGGVVVGCQGGEGVPGCQVQGQVQVGWATRGRSSSPPILVRRPLHLHLVHLLTQEWCCRASNTPCTSTYPTLPESPNLSNTKGELASWRPLDCHGAPRPDDPRCG